VNCFRLFGAASSSTSESVSIGGQDSYMPSGDGQSVSGMNNSNSLQHVGAVKAHSNSGNNSSSKSASSLFPFLGENSQQGNMSTACVQNMDGFTQFHSASSQPSNQDFHAATTPQIHPEMNELTPPEEMFHLREESLEDLILFGRQDRATLNSLQLLHVDNSNMMSTIDMDSSNMHKHEHYAWQQQFDMFQQQQSFQQQQLDMFQQQQSINNLPFDMFQQQQPQQQPFHQQQQANNLSILDNNMYNNMRNVIAPGLFTNHHSPNTTTRMTTNQQLTNNNFHINFNDNLDGMAQVDAQVSSFIDGIFGSVSPMSTTSAPNVLIGLPTTNPSSPPHVITSMHNPQQPQQPQQHFDNDSESSSHSPVAEQSNRQQNSEKKGRGRPKQNRRKPGGGTNAQQRKSNSVGTPSVSTPPQQTRRGRPKKM